MDSVSLFEKATAHGCVVLDAVRVDQLGLPTPCEEWSVQDLMDHMVGSTDYLLAALEGREIIPRVGVCADDYRRGRTEVLTGLAGPGALDRTCMSPLGFEWTVGQATAGTFMDNLIHSWDLAAATGQNTMLDTELVDACVAMFLPEMPERGRATGLVGPEIAVSTDASAQVRLLGAMGRRG